MFNVRDAALEREFALPGGAATTVSDGIEMTSGGNQHFSADCEIVVSAPVLTTAQLPNGQTVTYSVFQSDNEDFSGESVLAANVLVQTGADGAGAAASEVPVGVPSGVKKFIRLKVVKAGAADASGATANLSLRF